MTIRFGWLEAIIALFLGTYFGYLLLAFVTDIRIDRLRPYLQEASIKAGTKACAEEYERRYLQNEHVEVMKRKKRDAIIKNYAKIITRAAEME